MDLLTAFKAVWAFSAHKADPSAGQSSKLHLVSVDQLTLILSSLPSNSAS